MLLENQQGKYCLEYIMCGFYVFIFSGRLKMYLCETHLTYSYFMERFASEPYIVNVQYQSSFLLSTIMFQTVKKR